MMKRHLALLVGCIVLLGGCVAKSSALGQSGLPAAASFYTCTASDDSGNGTSAWSVEIDPSADADAILLKVGDGHPQELDAVLGGSDRLFANAVYAWRLAYPTPVLTDVTSYQTYQCTSR